MIISSVLSIMGFARKTNVSISSPCGQPHFFFSTQQNFENKLYHNECGGDFNLYVIHEVLITILSQNFS